MIAVFLDFYCVCCCGEGREFAFKCVVDATEQLSMAVCRERGSIIDGDVGFC
jgi:phosphoribosylamine-glycine ligase